MSFRNRYVEHFECKSKNLYMRRDTSKKLQSFNTMMNRDTTKN